MSHTDLDQPYSVLLRGEQIRHRLLEQIWKGLLVVVLVGGTLSVLRYLYTGWLPIYTMHIGLMGLYLVATALRGRMTMERRILFLLSFFTVVGVSAIVAFGLLGAGLWWLVLGALLADVFCQRRTALLYAGASLVVIVAIAIAYLEGYLTVALDADDYVRQAAVWMAMIVGCVLLTLFISSALTTYQRATQELLQEVERNRQQKEALLEEKERALAEIRRLQGFIPICAHCKKIRDDKGYWENVEAYVAKRADVTFSHCLCPDCGHQLYGEEWNQAMDDLARENPGAK
ncbi:MAG TPA: hypothetical protein VNR18_09455 [Hyphomicrobiales bacterium]|nr:hypothetical protein [Hyphomicrobiales bacterium]